MSELAIAPRVDLLLTRLDSWAERGLARRLAMKVGVTVTGPVVVLAGVAMLVLPGPGLVVIAAGLALLALEYPWARHLLAGLGHLLARARRATLPKDASPLRRTVGVAMIGAFLLAGFLCTTAITAVLGAHAIL